MERRLYERINADLPVKYICDDIQYAGTVNNISENGMFISTGNFLPCINSLEIFIPLNREIAKFSAKIRRIEKNDDSNYSMGVELLDPSDNYRQFVGNFRRAILYID